MVRPSLQFQRNGKIPFLHQWFWTNGNFLWLHYTINELSFERIIVNFVSDFSFLSIWRESAFTLFYDLRKLYCCNGGWVLYQRHQNYISKVYTQQTYTHNIIFYEDVWIKLSLIYIILFECICRKYDKYTCPTISLLR